MIVDEVLRLVPKSRPHCKLIFVFIAWCILGFAVAGRTQNVVPDQINPPFGFQWGEPEKDIEKTINRAQARIVTRDTVRGRDAWTVGSAEKPGSVRSVESVGSAGSSEAAAQGSPGRSPISANLFVAITT